MNTRLCLIMTCLLLSACQTQREQFTSIWSPAEVVADATAHPTDYNHLLDNPLGQTQDTSAVVNDPNKLLTLTDMSGNREYLILDRISQERGILTALIEFRYVKPQTLPANGMTYHYNQWREQIDCKNKVRILRTTTHYNMAGEIVDTIDYPLPKYKPAELAALAQPDDKVIQYVCERAGTTGLAVGDASVASTTDGKTSQSTETPNNKTHSKDKTKSKNPKEQKDQKDKAIKVDEKIDFISKGKAESASTPAAASDVAPPPATETPEKSTDPNPEKPQKSDKKTQKDKKDKKNKNKEKNSEKNQSNNNNKPTDKPHSNEEDVEVLEGEVQLKPI